MWFSNEFFTLLNNASKTQDDTDWLNQTLNSIKDKINSCENIQKLPEIRRKYVKRGSRRALGSWVFDGNSHYYIHTVGTRSELQPNIGVWADNRIRVGYGFELTKAYFGNPEKCHKFMESAVKVLSNRQANINSHWENCSNIYVESYSKEDNYSENHIESSSMIDFLTSFEKPEWLFFGHVINVNETESIPSILDETSSLKFIDTFFGETSDFYGAVCEIYKSTP
ncbi:hypothetical protein [Thiothrix caldifontis]|nr:hypothetical protein [Thiothrix caldifontis]